MPEPVRFVLVGHCEADSGSLARMIAAAAPRAQVAEVNDDETLAGHCDSRDVLLINRMLDGSFSAATGVEMIERLVRQCPQPPRMMLVSNYPDAQDAAVAAGALRGFGKSSLATAETRQLLASVASAASEPKPVR